MSETTDRIADPRGAECSVESLMSRIQQLTTAEKLELMNFVESLSNNKSKEIILCPK